MTDADTAFDVGHNQRRSRDCVDGPSGAGRPVHAIRRRGWGGLGLGFALSVASCGRGPTGPHGLEGSKSAQVEEDVSLGESHSESNGYSTTKLIRIGVRALPDKLDPLGGLGPWGERIADDLVFDGLTRKDGLEFPWAELSLAEYCEADDRYSIRKIRCKIREGVRFHDGTIMAPSDVLYSFRYWTDPRRQSLRERYSLMNLVTAELVSGPFSRSVTAEHQFELGLRPKPQRAVVDAPEETLPKVNVPGWIEISFDRHEPLAFEKLASIKVVPEKLHRSKASKFATSPIGTGRMEVVEMADGLIRLETAGRVQSLGEGEPEVIEFVAVKDGADGLTLMRRGTIHLLDRVSASHLPDELNRPGMAARFRAFLTAPSRYTVLIYNQRQRRMADRRFRRALSGLVPVDELDREIFAWPGLELASPVDLLEPYELLAGEDTHEFSLEEITQPHRHRIDTGRFGESGTVLDQLGWKMDGAYRKQGAEPLRTVLMWDGAKGRASRIADTLKRSWQSYGVRVPYATASWSYLRTLMNDGAFDIVLAQLVTDQDADLYPYFHSQGGLNIAAVADQELDGALVAYRRARTRSERDEAKRDISDRMGALEVATVVYAPSQVMLASNRFSGDVVFSNDLPRLDVLRLSPAVGWGDR